MLAGALVGVGILVWAVQPAAAQRPQFGGGFGGGGGIGMLAQNASVAKELNLTEEQTTKVKEAVDKVREAHKDELAKVREAEPADRREKMAEIQKVMGPETEKAVAGVLKTEQLKRLKQIELQTQGLRAFENADTQKALSLTDDQKAKIKDLAEASRKEAQEAFQDAGGDRTKMQEIMKTLADSRKKSLEKATNLLDDSQKKAWKDMTGEPFEVKFERGGTGQRPPRKPNNNI
jgi:Spy/CpxP family protein refolding chaperone